MQNLSGSNRCQNQHELRHESRYILQISYFLTQLLCQTRKPKGCCALRKPKTPLPLFPFCEFVLTWYVNEHLWKKIFTPILHYRNIDYSKQYISPTGIFTLKSKCNAGLVQPELCFGFAKHQFFIRYAELGITDTVAPWTCWHPENHCRMWKIIWAMKVYNQLWYIWKWI